MLAGRATKRIAFQRGTTTRSALGGRTTSSWAPLGSRLAQIFWGSGNERRSAAVEGAIQSASFRVLSDEMTRSVTAGDRIVYGALTFDITALAPVGRDIDFTGTASRG